MRSQPLLFCLVLAMVGCGGAQPEAASGTTTAPVQVAAAPRRNIDLDAYAYTTTIPLHHGEVVLGTNSTSDPQVAFALRAEVGKLPMSGCDYLEVQADEDQVELGNADYRRVSGSNSEELVALAPREALAKVAAAERTTLVTCNELIDLDREFRGRLAAFLRGERAPEETVVNDRIITLPGGTLSVAYRTSDPDAIRFQVTFEGGGPSSCPHMVLRAGSRSAEFHPPEGPHAAGVFFTTRAELRPVVSQSSARLIACGRTFELQSVELEVIAGLIGGS